MTAPSAAGGAAITGMAMRTCLGGTRETFARLLAGDTGVGPLRGLDAARLGVHHGYQIDDAGERSAAAGPQLPRPARWLAQCVREAAAQAGLDPARQRVAVIVGTGLRGLHLVEEWSAGSGPVALDDLHFAAAVEAALPGVEEVHTLSNACAASGYALGLAADLLEGQEADAVVAAGCDTITQSMLAMIGRVAAVDTTMVRPFDVDRTGVLLGEGAAAVVLEPAAAAGARALGRVLGVGLSCDAFHETAPDPAGVERAMRLAYQRAGVEPADVELVLAHGTGTALNDPTEAAALGALFDGVRPGPLVTAVKGATGHTSGAAALINVVVAVQAGTAGRIPPVAGLDRVLPRGERLRLVTGGWRAAQPRIAQCNAFGFGGLDAVCLVAASAPEGGPR